MSGQIIPHRSHPRHIDEPAPGPGALEPQAEVNGVLPAAVQDRGLHESVSVLFQPYDGDPVPAIQLLHQPVGQIQESHRAVGGQGGAEEGGALARRWAVRT